MHKEWERLDVGCFTDIASDGIGLYIIHRYETKEGVVQESLQFDGEKVFFEKYPQGQYVKPFKFIGRMDNDAQRLMDTLWNCGVRPTEGKGSAGQLTAVNSHLEDMRKIVFKKLGL